VTDASDTQVGAVFYQLTTSGWKTFAFFFAKLTLTQQKYSTFDRELLAAYLAVRHFRFLIEGCQFQLQTDHKPLSLPFTVVLLLGLRQLRQLAYISEFTADSPVSLDHKMLSLMPYNIPMLLPPSPTPHHQLIMLHLLLPNNLILPF
jgi:hypothetical protein